MRLRHQKFLKKNPTKNKQVKKQFGENLMVIYNPGYENNSVDSCSYQALAKMT